MWENGSAGAKLGSNLRIYGTQPNVGEFFGNGSTKVWSISKIGRFVGWGTVVFGVAMDMRGAMIYKDDPNSSEAVHPNKMLLNTAMGVYGMKWNPIAGLTYFGIDAFYPGGWDGVAVDQDALNKENSFNPYWQLYPGALKQ